MARTSVSRTINVCISSSLFSHRVVFCARMPGVRWSWEGIAGRSYRSISIRQTYSSTWHPRILFGTRRVKWDLLEGIQAFWTGRDPSTRVLQAWQSSAASRSKQFVGIAKTSSTQRQSRRACGVVGSWAASELRVSSYCYLPEYHVCQKCRERHQ